MIRMVRLDERLIHGQVATSWTKRLAVDSIIVIDDTSAKDPILTSTLLMAAPSNCKTVVKSYTDAMIILNDPRCANRSIFVVTKEIENLLKLAEAKLDIKEFNIGNYGRIQLKIGTRSRDTYEMNLYLYEEEKEQLKKLCEYGYPVSYQTTADTTKKELKTILGKDE